MDQVNAFVDREVNLKPTGEGQLTNLNFGVKDAFFIKGYTNSAGNPDWWRTHQPASETANVIEKLLAEGAQMIGTLMTDELMYSLNGENAHYGTPLNPKAIDRIPGGSSSGSASAVAAGLVDFSIGTDTGGSIRIPASYCGLYGIRPTHNAVDITGVIPMAKSFDVVGWMTQDIQLLTTIGDVLLPPAENTQPFKRFYVEEEAWKLPDTETAETLEKWISVIKNQVEYFETIKLAKEGLSTWTEIFRIIQALEVWEAHGEWITKEKPMFGPGIAERFQNASMLKKENHTNFFEEWGKIKDYVNEVLGEDGLLIIPTSPGPAPLLNFTGPEAEQHRKKTMKLTCIAGLAGLPQVTVPLADVRGLPVGLSFIAGRNQDRRLLQWVNSFVETHF